jgi:hypothetical protein
MASVLYRRPTPFTAAVTIKPVVTVPSEDQFSPNQFCTVVQSSKSESQWIRGGIPSRNYLRILERHHWRRL